MTTARRNLVLVRAGDDSLHPSWIMAEDRSFDLIVSYFGDAPGRYASDCEYYATHKGGKWDGVYRYFEANRHLLESYEYVWIPDDDIATDAACIDRMFALARRFDLEICQPALTHDSYFSYIETIGTDCYLMRYTNMVEIMIPCFSRDRLKTLLPLFRDTMSGFGLDMVWGRLSPPNALDCAILDVCRMQHTRPIGSALKVSMAAVGRDCWAERDDILAAFETTEITPMIHSARDLSGRLVRGRCRIGLMMAWFYWRHSKHLLQRVRLRHLRTLLSKQLASKAEYLHPSF